MLATSYEICYREKKYSLIHAILIKSHHLQRALKLDMTYDELAALLTPIHDYTISEIKNLLGALYLDIKVEIVPD